MRFFKKQFKRKKYRLGYKRLSTFWLKIMRGQLSKFNYEHAFDTSDHRGLHQYCTQLYYYFFKRYKHFFVDHMKNFGGVYLAFKVNQAYGLSQVGRGMFKWRFKYTRRTRKNGWTRMCIMPRYRPTRHLCDVSANREASFKWTYFRTLGGRNNFW